jgi:hypothetical protein
MENESIPLNEIRLLFKNRIEYVKKFYSVTSSFYDDIVKNNNNEPKDWNKYLISRQGIINQINIIEKDIFKLLKFDDKDSSKIIDILRSKQLKDIIDLELSTRDFIEKIITMDKDILKRINEHLSSSLSDFAEFEANKHSMQKTYLKMPEISSRFIDKKDE